MDTVAPDHLKAWNEFAPGPIQFLTTGKHQPKLSLLRLDTIRSWASGNKYYKLKYPIQHALTHGITTIVSKGGPFSNHLAALGEACHAFGIHLVAIVRSYTPDEQSPTVIHLKENGCEIVFVTPREYKQFNAEVAEELYPDSLFIPEGGLSNEGLSGTAEITQEMNSFQPTHVILPGGTMGTACGIISSAPASTKVIIVPAWKGCRESYVAELLEQFNIEYHCTWELWPDYHFGGFGKYSPELISFMSAFTADTGVVLDPVYTGKMLYALEDKIDQGYFNEQDQLMAIHTGGLQGLAGYRYRFPEDWGEYCAAFMNEYS